MDLKSVTSNLFLESGAGCKQTKGLCDSTVNKTDRHIFTNISANIGNYVSQPTVAIKVYEIVASFFGFQRQKGI